MEKFLKGEILTADKLNQLVNELNELSNDNNGIITGSSTASGQSDYVVPKFIKPEFTDMHDYDGVPVILDGLTGSDCSGLFARTIEATTYFSDNFNGRHAHKDLNKIANDVNSSQYVFQKVTLDYTGSPINSEVVVVDRCSDENPANVLPDYSRRRQGTIWRRLARVDVNCRINGVSDPSKQYKVIKTPEYNVAPFVANEHTGAVSCVFNLLSCMNGNTYPIKAISPGCGITMEDAGGAIIISANNNGGGGNCDGGRCDYCADPPIIISCDKITLCYNPCHFGVCGNQLVLKNPNNNNLDTLCGNWPIDYDRDRSAISLRYDCNFFDVDSKGKLTLKSGCAIPGGGSYCALPPIVICGNEISLMYNDCHFSYDSYRGLMINCSLLNNCAQNIAFNQSQFYTYNGEIVLNCNFIQNELAPLKGVVNSSGTKVPWSSLKNRTEPLFYFYVDCTEIAIGATLKDGYLQMFGINS